jgi:hypothetical protein
MAAAEIRETIVTPADPSGAAFVQLQISDTTLLAEDAAIRLTLAVSVPGYEAPLLAQLQRAAMTIARDSLSDLLRRLAQEIQGAGYSLNPTQNP